MPYKPAHSPYPTYYYVYLAFIYLYKHNILVFTCDASCTMATRKPLRNAAKHIISTLTANTINNQHADNGIPASKRVRRLPHRIAAPPKGAPKRAPSSDKLASHDACCPFTGKASASRCWREAIAGEL